MRGFCYFTPEEHETRLNNVRSKMEENSFDAIRSLTDKMVESVSYCICAPEYNGSIPPVVTNAIAWISVTTDYWKDAFRNKHALIGSSSGGPATKYQDAIKNQLIHLGSIVYKENIIINSSNNFDKTKSKKIINQFINLL